MSVEKYIISKSEGNFTTIPNKVLQGLKNYAALGLYCYIASLPPGWEFNKQQLCKHGNIGRDKIDALIKTLEVHELVRTEQKRNKNGSFSHIELHVDDGTSFKINNLEKFEPPFTDLPLTANQGLVNTHYKENINKSNKDIKDIKDKRYCPSDDEPKSFEQFWSLYPRKQKRKDAAKAWLKNKLHSKADEIIMHLMKRIETEWKGKSKTYIPLPTTFLNGEGWHDEIITNENVIPIKPSMSQHNRNVSYVMEKLLNGK